ncbi:5-oxoprolinase subunit PxpB [Colwellia sp. 12G3]|uniref:5-oxoprolinase subunit PxpB n=1 Tax=Colwellia sp. 12G3 TaxID=2058299 RepID=UPI000C31F89B|nr:5-oxoprolinase subunit PxpB [Colwellia sp. 12G3]PKI16734.1 allophanate hydrolase [Colwellia sp. 12G3]
MSTQINDCIRLEVAGENALMLYFSSKKSLSNEQKASAITPDFSPVISHDVHQAVQLIRRHFSVEIIDLIPSYASILVVFNLLEIDHHHLRNKLKKLLQQGSRESSKEGRLIELPAYYSLESGMDLSRIAKHAKLSIKQVINLHQAQEYRVYAIGFAPGFAYLGEVDERIAMPRLTTPRLKVPKGAIAIADRQTAVYPAESPGGWHIIGLCPIDMFNPLAEPTMPIEVGDRVKFVPIDKQQYLELDGHFSNKVSLNDYK